MSVDVTEIVLRSGFGGLARIPAAGTELTRLNYFEGKFLRAQDLQLEQDHLRARVERSNHADAAGVVRGFEASMPNDDVVNVTPGLAVDRDGRLLLLETPIAIAIDALIAENAPAAGATGYYVLTIAHAEGICGTASRVEGVALRARPFTVGTLPTSTTIRFGDRHLRSLLASALFGQEVGASLISGPGLKSMGWCAGARFDAPAEVALAIVARRGQSTVLFDQWSVRRERIDRSAYRWWAVRMDLRPWSAFLAQVLQFQCQLPAQPSDGPPPAAPIVGAR
jgi:hypothetical protein